MSSINYEALDEALNLIEVIEEGANMELTKKMSSTTKEYKAACKAAKEAVKQHDFKTAKSKVNVALKAAEDLKKYADDMKAEKNSAFVGFFLGSLYGCCQCIVPIAICTVGAIGIVISSKMNNAQLYRACDAVAGGAAIATSVKELIDYFNDVKQQRENERNDKGSNDTYNYYRIKVQGYASKLIENTKKLNNLIEKTEKKYNEIEKSKNK